MNPNSAISHMHYGWYLTFVGRFDDAIREMKEAQALDPLSLSIYVTSGNIYYWARDYDLSLQQYRKALPLLFLTVLSPLVEEIEFRGFGVRQLQRGTGWSFWVAVWPSALLCGLGHVEQGQSLREMAGLFFLTGAGAVTFAWLVYRWQNLWVAVALHICMNLWWRLFSISNTAIGSWFPFTVQNLTMLLAIFITLYRTRSNVTAVTPPEPHVLRW